MLKRRNGATLLIYEGLAPRPVPTLREKHSAVARRAKAGEVACNGKDLDICT